MIKKDFTAIREEMYRIIYSFQKEIDDSKEIDQSDLLSIFIDYIAGIYDGIQYYFDKLVRVVNPAIVLYHKNSEYYPHLNELLEIFRFRDSEITEELTSIRDLRKYYIGRDLDDINYTELTDAVHVLVKLGILDYNRSTLLRALIESWLYVLQQLDLYFYAVVSELTLEPSKGFGNIAGYAELLGYPLNQRVPLSANVIISKEGYKNIEKGTEILIQNNTWTLPEGIVTFGYQGEAFSEKVIKIREDKKAIIVAKTCSNQIGELVLLKGNGWEKYACIKGITRTSLYAEYELTYKGIIPADPITCTRVITMEQRRLVKLEVKSTGFLNQVIFIPKVSYLPEHGLKNRLMTVEVDGTTLNYEYKIPEEKDTYTERYDSDGNLYLILGGINDFDSSILVRYYTWDIEEIKKGTYSYDGITIEVLEDSKIEETRIWENAEVDKKTICKTILHEVGKLLRDGNTIGLYANGDIGIKALAKTINMYMKCKLSKPEGYYTDMHLTLYQRRIVAEILNRYNNFSGYILEEYA